MFLWTLLWMDVSMSWAVPCWIPGPAVQQLLLMKNVLMVIKSSSVSEANRLWRRWEGFIRAVRHRRVSRVCFYLERLELQFDGRNPAFCELPESYRAAGAGTMAVLWHCCWCLLNAQSGSGGLKSALKGLADQRGVSSASFAAESRAGETIQTRRWRSGSRVSDESVNKEHVLTAFSKENHHFNKTWC